MAFKTGTDIRADHASAHTKTPPIPTSGKAGFPPFF
jgi:hypothetical protein